MRLLTSLFLVLCLSGLLSAQPVPNDDEFWAQRITTSAAVVSSQLDHQGRLAGIAMRRNQKVPDLLESWPFGTAFVFPENLPTSTRIRSARAQAAGTITQAWLRYTAEINAACLETNQALRYPTVSGEQVYQLILGR